MAEELLLQANDFVSKFQIAVSGLLEDNDFVDVTLACHDGQVSAHRVILCASSSLFRTILRNNPHPHPLLYMKGVSIKQLNLLLQFVYRGEVRIDKGELEIFLNTARELQIEGLENTKHETKEALRANEKWEETESIKCEPENYKEFDCVGTSYAEDENSLENIEMTAENENDMLIMQDMSMKNNKVKKLHKGSSGGRLLRNPVWDYFVKLDNRSCCTKCGFSLMGFNTSTLIKHLENRHLDIYTEYRDKYQLAWNDKMSHNNQKQTINPGCQAESPPKTRPRRVQGRLNKNPAHNFFTRIDSYSNCNQCQANMLGHNPTTLAKHLESQHPEQFIQFSELYRLAWEEKRKMIKEKKKLAEEKQEIADQQQEESLEQWNDTFQIGHSDDPCEESMDGTNNFIEWNSDGKF